MGRAAERITPIFVSAKTGAELCEIGIDKWREWVRRGVLPPPVVNDGQIIRWHWPTVERALADRASGVETDPSVLGVRNAKAARRAVA